MLGFLFRWRWKRAPSERQSPSDSPGATPPQWPGSSPASGADGYVELVGSELRVVEPSGPAGQWPLVVPGPGVTVRRDGVVMTAPFVATRAQRLEVEVATGEQELRPRRFRVELAADRMTAELWLESAETQREVLVNPGKVRVLELRTQAIRVVRPNPSVEAILAELERLGVTEGIDRAAVENLLNQEVEIRGVIARGTPPTPPRDARVEWMVETGHGGVVKPGTLLAKVFPAEPGQPGRDLTGTLLPPPAAPPVSLTLTPGEGTALTPEGTGLIAVAEGRPAVEEQDGAVRVKIIPVLVHRGDLSASTGTIFFHGDVHVLGQVREGTHIACDGDVRIEGNVERSLVHAAGRATLRGRVIRSRIRVGKPVAQTSGLVPKLTGLRDLLGQLETACVQILHHPRYSQVAQGRLRPVLNLLLQHRFSQFTPLLSAIQAELPGTANSVRSQLIDLTKLTQSLADPRNEAVTLESLRTAARLAAEAIDSIRRLANLPTDNRVELYYAFASELECTGPVVVSGPGIENTIIRATGPVDIHGYMRGGSIRCARNVSIGQIGTPGGKVTEVVVSEGYSILADKVYPNTILQVGQIKHTFQREQSMVEFSTATAETYRKG